jgi:hypothetical protein
MLITYYGSIPGLEKFEVEYAALSMREVFSFLDFHTESKFSEELLKYPHFMAIQFDNEEILVLDERLLLVDLPKNTIKVLILPDVGAGIPVAAVAAGFGAAASAAVAAGTISMTTIAIYAVTAIINIGLSIGLNMLMNALSPTQSFDNNTNPAEHKTSNLFNSTKLVRGQGGSVPVVFGAPHCTGVLIGSSISSIEI